MEHGFFYLACVAAISRIGYEVISFRGKVTPLALYCFCYLYFCFGPYLANLLGFSIYSGIQKAYLDEAAFVFFLAIITLTLFPANTLSRIESPLALVVKSPKLVKQICLLAMALPVCALFALAFARIGFSGMDKVQRIQAVGIVHYVLLTLWPLLLFILLTVTPRKALAGKEPWMVGGTVLLYFAYCFYMGERDFALLALPLFFWLYKDHPISTMKLALLATGGVTAFTLMSLGRGNAFEGGGLSAFLNQGSNLMVTSNILAWLEQGQQVMWGQSYFSGLVNMLTLGAIKLTLPLSIWFSRAYSPAANDGAYGFSIEGEALINFGLAGVPFLFAFIALFLAVCYRGYLAGRPLGVLLTYFNLFYFIYAIRGESLILFKSFIYCLILFFGLLMLSQRGRLYFRVA
ncbi:hypothetical protein OCL06_03435 [Alteromonas sp. ASW11-19]|uniref:Oligosaccharide repeat unit polymerase n=1 Tax=Alteromonas salexigens TaxID=2982530 RepID=A0ABT2VLF6_9ALTE|nr:hypothetical protein [Alteromonas salexigens]MCU7553652.1 hypothetical protein [Alteromonas salexigens]